MKVQPMPRRPRRCWPLLGPPAIPLREPPLDALAGALACAALYLGNDSGVSHLAAAVGAPSVVLFTRALLGWRPWAPRPGCLRRVDGKIDPRDLEEVLAAARAAMA